MGRTFLDAIQLLRSHGLSMLPDEGSVKNTMLVQLHVVHVLLLVIVHVQTLNAQV